MTKPSGFPCASCHFISTSRGAEKLAWLTRPIVDRALFLETDDLTKPRQGRLCLEAAKLSEGFFEQLKRHPLPLEEAAIKSLNNQSAALDCYLWLAYRLHVLNGDRTISRPALEGPVWDGF